MRPAPLAVLIAALSCGCDADGPSLRPVVVTPPPESEAYPYAAIDELVLSVARAGDDDDLALQSTVLGDEPSLGDVPFGDDLVVHLSGRVEGLEVAYGRTCSVSVGADGASVEAPSLYFSRLVRWGPAPAVDIEGAALAYASPGGDGVFVGDGIAAVFDAYAGAFRPFAAELAPRTGAVLARVGGGRAAVLVGGLDGTLAVPTVELMLPANPRASTELETVDRIESQPGPALVDHAAITLVGGEVLVAGGVRPPDLVVGEAWMLTIGAEGLDPPARVPGNLVVPRAQHTLTRMGDEIGADVLILGGLGEDGAPVAQAELFRPLRAGFEAVPGAELITPRYGHRAVRLPGGFVLVVGGLRLGIDGEPEPVRELELYDPVQGVFSAAGVLPAAAGVIDVAVTTLPDGRVLFSGGRDLDGAQVSAVFIARFDPIDGVVDVIDTDGLDAPRSGHAAALLCDGSVLVVGGGAGPERYSPPSAGRR